MATQTGKFDLNMEEVLEAWGPADATREILANALNEQALTDGDDPVVSYEERAADTSEITVEGCDTSISLNQKTTKN